MIEYQTSKKKNLTRQDLSRNDRISDNLKKKKKIDQTRLVKLTDKSSSQKDESQ